jgi:hypothetical protein
MRKYSKPVDICYRLGLLAGSVRRVALVIIKGEMVARLRPFAA